MEFDSSLIHRLDRIARRRSEIALAPMDLRPRHAVALMILRDHGAMTQAALGEALNAVDDDRQRHVQL